MNNLRTIAVWLLLCIIWSSTWIVIKLGLVDLPPVSFAGIRFVIASAVLLLICAARGVTWPKTGRAWAFLAFTGFLTFSVNYGLLFWGEQQVASGLAAVLQAGIPASALIFAHIYLPGERLTFLKVAGVLCGLVGIGIIFADELHVAGLLAMLGSVAIVVGGMSTAYASVLVKAYSRDMDPGVLAGTQMLFGWMPLVVLGWALEGAPWHFHWTATAISSVLYLALIGSALAFCLFYWLVRRTDVTRVMLISLVTPVAAVLIGAAVLNEHLPPRTLAGGVFVLIGLALVIFRRSPRLLPDPAAPAQAAES